MQTGKTNIVPIVMIASKDNDYWKNWEKHILQDLLEKGMISSEDKSLFHIASSPQDAVDHILQFYKNFHSRRYVQSNYIIRIQNRLTEESIDVLNDSFQDILNDGFISQSNALKQEKDHLELPRIIVPHTRRSYGRLRQLIDTITSCDIIT